VSHIAGTRLGRKTRSVKAGILEHFAARLTIASTTLSK